MLNIHDLERRWIKYKIKSSIPFVLSVFSVTAIIVVAVLYLPLSNIQDQDTQEVASVETVPKKEAIQPEPKEESPQKTPATVEIDVPQNTQMQTPSSQETSLVLKPSLRFMDNIEDSLSPYAQEPYQMPQQNRIAQNNMLNYQSESVMTEQTEAIQEEKKEEESKLTLTVTTEKDDDDLKDVIRRFKKNKNPTLSLFIAKHYYQAGNYQKSYNYALMTNEIDKTIEESWIIFSKSLVKLGQKDLAMNTLKSYLKTTKSSAAEVLLRKIESDDFK